MEPRHLLTTDYGRILGVKVLLALGAFALGFYNWRVVRPQLDETPRTRLVRIPTAVELILAACVLAVTAALVVTPTP
jgi:putative copper export protein